MPDDENSGSATPSGSSAAGEPADAAPAGGVYEWLQRGMVLLTQGNAAAAATLLERVRGEDPASASVLEALARARYDAGQFEAARSAFADLLHVSPDSDYAHFGLGLSLFRLGRVDDAEPHLALAAVMRPGRAEYSQRLREVRATRAARRGELPGQGHALAGTPDDGAGDPIGDPPGDPAGYGADDHAGGHNGEGPR